jgi:hypothetical protein
MQQQRCEHWAIQGMWLTKNMRTATTTTTTMNNQNHLMMRYTSLKLSKSTAMQCIPLHP